MTVAFGNLSKLRITVAGSYTAPVGALPIGTLTRANMGVYAAPPGAVSITGGTASGYTVVDGYLAPSSDGSATSGTVTFNTGQTFTMSLEDGYSVRTIDQLIEVAQLSGLTLGQEILVPDGEVINPTYDTIPQVVRTTNPVGTFDGTNHVVIRPHTGATAKIQSIGFNGASGGTRYFKLKDFSADTLVPVEYSVPSTGLFRCTSGAQYITFENITATSPHLPDMPYADRDRLATVFYSGYTGNSFISVINTTINGALYGIQGAFEDGLIEGCNIQYCLADSLQFAGECSRLVVRGNVSTNKYNANVKVAITNIVKGATTQITMDPTGFATFAATDVTNGTGVGYNIKLSDVVGLDGYYTGPMVVTASDAGTSTVTVSYDSSALPDYISGGLFGYSIAHSDHMQGNFFGASRQDNMIIENNVLTRGNGAAGWVDGQGVFVSGGDVKPDGTIIRNNIVVTTLANSVLAQSHTNCIIENNTVVVIPDVVLPATTPTLNLFNADAASIVRNNIVHSFGTPGVNTPTYTNNFVIPATEAALLANFVNPQIGEERTVDGWADYAVKPGSDPYLATPQAGAYQPV